MTSSTTESQATETDQGAPEMTHELALKVAERVIQLLKQEARIESERHRPCYNHQPIKQGGR